MNINLNEVPLTRKFMKIITFKKNKHYSFNSGILYVEDFVLKIYIYIFLFVYYSEYYYVYSTFIIR
jgi:hypothetical protein